MILCISAILLLSIHTVSTFTISSISDFQRGKCVSIPGRDTSTTVMFARHNRRSNQQSQQDFLDFMEQPFETADRSDVVTDDVLDLIHTVCRAADGRKAENIVALSIQSVSSMATAQVFVSGNSRPQNQAISSAIQKECTEYLSISKVNPEGSSESGWMLLDFGSVIVHVMTPKSRLFYNVEGQWKEKGAIELDLSGILTPISFKEESKVVDMEDDPFWS